MLRHKRRRLMSASGESTSRRVDSGEEPLDTFHEHANTDEIMDDTLAAIHVLLSRYHAEFAAMNLPSLVLWHQLYSLVENRTAVDQSVQRMRNSGLIMTLRISLPGPHAMAILLTSDYIAFMLQYTKQHRATRVFAKALPQLTKSPILTASGFVDAVESLFRSRQRTPPSSSVLEQDLTHLVQSRFLVASTNLEAKQFYFTLPRLGMVITGIARARKALTNLLKVRTPDPGCCRAKRSMDTAPAVPRIGRSRCPKEETDLFAARHGLPHSRHGRRSPLHPHPDSSIVYPQARRLHRHQHTFLTTRWRSDSATPRLSWHSRLFVCSSTSGLGIHTGEIAPWINQRSRCQHESGRANHAFYSGLELPDVVLHVAQ
ncbi:hypothetical protein H310_11258 [Aphanomyces invadans]|uniref:Uncharacterized protein n=1 Tax=Aphanomyces invadans TaxID=157072 RepID=A0A024TMY6_9STRA|nr:hypothetical protein H310_11258 [Aphanomyces invadans]ETV95373.1 hypothetical protein H310_11258 [Aphanomyces invadans]|eukprot:XP_008876074.1 hypothetical protein H310_11258 [Aphanomyces invadans]